jgi:hypothetical protein
MSGAPSQRGGGLRVTRRAEHRRAGRNAAVHPQNDAAPQPPDHAARSFAEAGEVGGGEEGAIRTAWGMSRRF